MRLTIIGILVLLSILITGCASGSPAGTSSPAAVVVEEHDHSVEIEGSAMRTMTVKQIANLWEIDAEKLLSQIISEFNLQNQYSVDSTIDDLRKENKFSPAAVKDIAETLKEEAST